MRFAFEPKRSLIVLIGIIIAVTATVSCLPLMAEDITPPVQAEGQHSFVGHGADPDNVIRDDELIDFICERINATGVKVKDIKLLVDANHSAGFLDDMERAFGAGGACPGIPWVAGASGSLNQNNYQLDELLDDDAEFSWTAGLASPGNENNALSPKGVITDGSPTNFVLPDLVAAGENDGAGPNGRGFTLPLVASGNDGDVLPWSTENSRHQAVLWRTNSGPLFFDYLNNVNHIEKALGNVWPGGTFNIFRPAPTREALFEAIGFAIDVLDEDTQLLIYLTGSGGSLFDIALANDLIGVPITDPTTLTFDIPDGWFEAMAANQLKKAPDPLHAGLWFDPVDCDGCEGWEYELNRNFLLKDERGVPLNQFAHKEYRYVFPGENELKITPKTDDAPKARAAVSATQADNGSLTLNGLVFTTGPLAPVPLDQVLLPGQSAAFYDPGRNGEGLFIELLPDQIALVYMFSYSQDGTQQAWMLGVGLQTGEGIVLMTVLQPAGAKFGPDFDPGDIVTVDFGSLVMKMPTCGTSEERGELFVYPGKTTGYDFLGSENYAQLSNLLSCDTAMGSAKVKYSGSWYDPTHNGEGIIFQVLENGQGLVQWFTYDDQGNQMWLQGIGEFDGDTLTVSSLLRVTGTAWGDSFDPGDVVVQDWGSLEMTFSSCGAATVTYDSSVGFGSGMLNMVRLTSLMGIPCSEGD